MRAETWQEFLGPLDELPGRFFLEGHVLVITLTLMPVNVTKYQIGLLGKNPL
jgi:hypothetical protein